MIDVDKDAELKKQVGLLSPLPLPHTVPSMASLPRCTLSSYSDPRPYGTNTSPQVASEWKKVVADFESCDTSEAVASALVVVAERVPVAVALHQDARKVLVARAQVRDTAGCTLRAPHFTKGCSIAA